MTLAISADGRLILKIPTMRWFASYDVADIPIEVAVMIAYLQEEK